VRKTWVFSLNFYRKWPCEWFLILFPYGSTQVKKRGIPWLFFFNERNFFERTFRGCSIQRILVPKAMSQLQITDELSGVNHNSITKYLVGLNRSRIRRGQYSADGLFASLVDSNLKFLYIPSRSTLSSSSWSRPDLAHEIVPLNSPRPTPALTHHWFVFFLFHAMEKLSKSYLSKKKLIIILSKLMKSPQTPRYGW